MDRLMAATATVILLRAATGHWWPGVLLLVLVEAISCVIWPFRDCWVCKGRGNHRPDGRRKLSRPCWWCKAAGRRLRYGRRIYNHFRAQRNAAR